MEEIVFKSDDLTIMSLINYFITEKNYNPMIIHGINDEIWLENLNEEYKIVRIVSHHIHNKEQLDFDKFKLSRVVKQVKKKTLSFKVKVLNIYTDLEDEKLLSNDDVMINNEEDINNPKLTNAFPNIVEKTKRDEEGLEYFIKVTDNINKQNESKSKIAEKIFSFKKPIITYSIIFICVLVFILMYVLGNGSTDNYTLLLFGANLDALTKNGDYYRLLTSMFLHIGIMHLLCNMYSLYIIGKEVENVFGKWKYLVIYILSGIAGSILSLAFNHNTICAGASGAIFGLLGALLYFGYYYRPYLGATLTRSIIPVIAINLIVGFLDSGIDNSAHIGGLVGGLLVAMAVGVPDKSNNNNKINGIVLSLIYFGFIIYLSFFR
ncbi:MAG: rhomboid family intramembrane serine protease [Firmicutes bacterium]|nr:rhomboid family intramembrane serine protease [Bacillota bacterium]MDY5335884.1 rhomboid family intramembrane serine protease [Bacilli bacterium]